MFRRGSTDGRAAFWALAAVALGLFAWAAGFALDDANRRADGGSDSAERPADRAPRVGVLIEGAIYDQGWDSEAYAALQALERHYGADVAFVEFHNAATPEKIASALERFIAEGRTLLIGHGAVFGPVIEATAPHHPDVQFVSINGPAAEANVVSVHFSGRTMGILAGAAAALMSRTGIVGIVSAYPDLPEVDGFRAGARYARPETVVLARSVGSWGDRPAGRAAAEALIRQGADVLFPAGDGFSIDVIDVARRHGRYAVGFIIDQSFIARNAVITSVTQDVRRLYTEIFLRARDGTLDALRGQVLDVKNGYERLSGFGPMVPKPVAEAVERLYEALRTGKLTEADLDAGGRRAS
ncbi:BMP family ABC transporter substrate-binding protein [Hydrogenibacillus sp. N12]|uniref:BMP family ABC transporter substrate-binding protein n=1 Tax=Hydrogenibacillus sp. N12 TaxID=2866627 RepID=UPI00207C0E06|nr:BMP family ABC transporter substrate-binding protein [Hydrogenibacillus sp. N12]